MAIELAESNSGPYPYQESTCKFTGFATLLNMFASSFFLVWMAIYRAKKLIKVCSLGSGNNEARNSQKTSSNKKGSDRRYLKAVIIWLAASLLASQALMFRVVNV